jgi:hypothetical protein
MAALTGPAVVRDRVREQLGRVPGEVSTAQNGAFLVSRGPHVTAVQVIGLQPDVTLVFVFAVVATNVVQLDGACRLLATRGLDLPLVHFELVDDGKALIAAHGLLGEFVSGPDLVAAVDAVSEAAETLGTEVRGRFGGTTTVQSAPVDPTGSAWLFQPVRDAPSRPAPSARTVTRASMVAVTASALVVALVLATSIWWGVGSGLAATLVLLPLLWALVLGPALRRSRAPGSRT